LEENNWIIRTFGNNSSFWIGLAQKPEMGEPAGGWQWISGEKVTFTNWDSGQPDNYTGRDNDTMLLSNAGGKWHDVPLKGWPTTSKFRGIFKLNR